MSRVEGYVIWGLVVVFTFVLTALIVPRMLPSTIRVNNGEITLDNPTAQRFCAGLVSRVDDSAEPPIVEIGSCMDGRKNFHSETALFLTIGKDHPPVPNMPVDIYRLVFVTRSRGQDIFSLARPSSE